MPPGIDRRLAALHGRCAGCAAREGALRQRKPLQSESTGHDCVAERGETSAQSAECMYVQTKGMHVHFAGPLDDPGVPLMLSKRPTSCIAEFAVPRPFILRPDVSRCTPPFREAAGAASSIGASSPRSTCSSKSTSSA